MKPCLIPLFALFGAWLADRPVLANLPGGGTGTGPNVTVVDNGNGTVTMANGTVSLLITKSGATINQINYTYNNGGGTQTRQLLAGGKDGGMFYWEFGGFGGNPWAYSLVANTGSYAEVDLYSDSATNGTVDIHFAMLRGSPGFYVTGIWSHRAQDAAQGTGEERDNIYIAPYFNWMSVDGPHDRELGLNYSSAPAFYSPQENSLTTSGILQGTYDDKYKFSADWGLERVWGWSSVSDATEGFTGQNVGIWHVIASAEYYNGGPLKPELMDAPMVNMINGGHYYMGSDSGFGAGEPWTRVSGPYFIYLNNVTNTLTDPVATSRALLADAQAQAAAEQTAWPYNWFVNTNYAGAAQRGTVTGQFVINDPYNPAGTASNLWVGLVQQPLTIDGVYDFQEWEKPYQFWVKSDANGNFALPNVIAGGNYTLYAFGPGAAGTFMSHAQNGGNPPLVFNLPASPFYVTVTGGATNNLGTVTWTPTRVGPTVFEIGYPDRKSDKFRHGDDYWVGDVGPSPTAPSPVWTKFIEFPYDFPNGLNYVVGQSRWGTDWNFIQPPVFTFAGVDVASSSTITFNLPSVPASGVTAGLFLGIASDDNGPLLVTINGTLLSSSVTGVSGSPVTTLPTTGYFPGYSGSDTDIREENHAAYSDEILRFPASLLRAGTNTINIAIRMAGGASFYNHAMYDYLRLELPGYVPPPPAGVTVWPGNNQTLLSWPATPGAVSYNLLRATVPGGGWLPLTNGVLGPVCGSGPANATYVDTSAVNGTTYYYAVQAVNSAGASTKSPASAGAAPNGGLAVAPPAAPAGLSATTSNAVTLAWSPSPGANCYTIYRGTVVNLLGYVPVYIVLSNTTTNTTYTDASGTLGCTYSYYVTATTAAGTSGPSAAITAKPAPPPPAAPPGNFHISVSGTTNQTAYLSWSAVPGAVGYILYRSTSPNGPYNFPGNFVQTVTTGNYTDGGLNSNTLYSYMVVAMNAGGISGNSAIVSTPPAAPAGLNVYSGNGQITLVWPPSPGATSYTIKRGGSSGAETTLATTTNTTYTDTGLINGVTYYYVVTATGTGGGSINSPEAATAPFSGTPAVYWIDALTTAAQGWNVNSNWSNGTAFPNAVQAAAVVNAPIAAAQTVSLNQPVTVGALSLGASGGAFTIAGGGGSLTLDNTPGQPSLLELAASKGDVISAPMTLNGTLVVSNASASALTLAGAITGAHGLLIAGPGTVTLAGTNSYTGPTTVGAATLQLNSAAAASTTTIALTGGSTLYENNVAFGNVLNNSGTNTWTAYGSTTYYPGAMLTGSGQLNLNITGAGVFSPGGDWSQFAGTIAWPAGNGAGCRLYGSTGSANASWNLGTGTGSLYNRNGGVTVSLGALTGGPGTALTGASSATAATTYAIGALNLNSTFSGRVGDGQGATTLLKTGTGTLTLTGTNNNYTGGTTINAGTLLVNNNSGSGAGSGTLLVASSGTLGGTGIITGVVSVNAGGTLAPGTGPAAPGSLTISNNLTLAAGSTALFQVLPSPLTNSALKVSGTLTRGGTLSVTNSGATALAAGDSFKLFGAGTYAGAFASVILPPLPVGLAWNTNSLATAGTLSVVAATHPSFGSATVTASGLVLSGTAGVAGADFYLLGTTNLNSPASNWARLLTNQFDSFGNFSVTNQINPDAPQSFYQLQLP